MAATQHIYVGQPLTVSLDTQISLSAATSIKIRYKKPDGTTGLKTATAVGTVISASFTKTEIDAEGKWEFRAWVEFGADTGYVPGVPYWHHIEAV